MREQKCLQAAAGKDLQIMRNVLNDFHEVNHLKGRSTVHFSGLRKVCRCYAVDVIVITYDSNEISLGKDNLFTGSYQHHRVSRLRRKPLIKKQKQ